MINKLKESGEEQLKEFIAEISSTSPPVQLSRLKKVKERLELEEMYYEQKGNDRGLVRVNRCIALIDNRIIELIERTNS